MVSLADNSVGIFHVGSIPEGAFFYHPHLFMFFFFFFWSCLLGGVPKWVRPNIYSELKNMPIYIYNLGTLFVCLSVSSNLSHLKSHLHEILAQDLFWANLKHCEVGFLNFDFLRGAAIYP